MRVSSSSAAAVLQATLGADAYTAVSAATMQRCLRFDQGGTLLGCDSKHASTATGALCGWAHEGGTPCRVTAAPHAACTSMHCPAGAYARSRFRVCSQPPPKSHLRPLHLGCPTTRGRGAHLNHIPLHCDDALDEHVVVQEGGGPDALGGVEDDDVAWCGRPAGHGRDINRIVLFSYRVHALNHIYRINGLV